MSKFTEIRPVGAEFFSADGRTDLKLRLLFHVWHYCSLLLFFLPSSRCNGLGGGNSYSNASFLYKKMSEKKRHQYWVHPVLCTRLETVSPKWPAAALFHLKIIRCRMTPGANVSTVLNVWTTWQYRSSARGNGTNVPQCLTSSGAQNRSYPTREKPRCSSATTLTATLRK
jgi:hypothetical protein